MEVIVRGIILILVGCAAVILRKKIVQESFAFQGRVFGLKFSDKEIRANERAALFIGLIFVVLGVLSLFGIIWS